jgi:hypothetical protein
MAHKGFSGQTLPLWESWVCTVHRPKTQPCRAMPLHVGSCSRLASESWLSTVFSFSFGKLWAMVGERFTEFTAKRQKKVQYPVKVHMVQAKFNY